MFDIINIVDVEDSHVIHDLERVKSAELSRRARESEAIHLSKAMIIEAQQKSEAEVVRQEAYRKQETARIQQEITVAEKRQNLMVQEMEIFNVINIPWFPWINELSILNDRDINNVKNIAVLAFFILSLVIIGIYEIRKYHKERRKPREEGLEEEKEILLPESSIYEPQPTLEEESLEGLDSGDYKEENGNNIEKSSNDV